MRKRSRPAALAVLLTAAVLQVSLFTAPAVAAKDNGKTLAAVSPASCPGAYVTLWENSNYGGSSITACYGTNIDNLANYGAIYCQGGPLDWPYDWNDCISSFHVYNSSCHYGFSQYADAGYSGILPGPLTGFGNIYASSYGAYNDVLSSFRWSYRPTCPNSP